VRAQVITKDGLIEWLTRLVSTRVRMRVDQAGEQPAFGGQPGPGDRVVGPPVTVREQVNNIAAGQGNPADPHDIHQTTLTAATADKEAALRVSGSTGFCLDVPGAQTTPGLQLQTWRCNGTLAQQFWVVQ
jgi:hypothetical protein